MMAAEHNALVAESLVAIEVAPGDLTWSERLVRWILMAGFAVVMAVEVWLLYQAWEEVF